MADQHVRQQILEQLNRLDPAQQKRVLAFVRVLAGAAPVGAEGPELLRFAGAIPLEDLKVMAQGIEEECERVDFDEW